MDSDGKDYHANAHRAGFGSSEAALAGEIAHLIQLPRRNAASVGCTSLPRFANDWFRSFDEVL